MVNNCSRSISLVLTNVLLLCFQSIFLTHEAQFSDQGNKKDANAFGWKQRYNVAIGVAEALDYLHNGCEEPVIHRDVKSSNILLSDDFEPQVLCCNLSVSC